MDQCSHHIETSQLICSANQLTGFYMMGTLVDKWLSSEKSHREMNIGKYFWRWLSLVHLTPTLEDSANLMEGKPFYFKLKFSVAKSKQLSQQDIS